MNSKNGKSQKIIYRILFLFFSTGISFLLIPVPEPPISLKEKEAVSSWSLPSLERRDNIDMAYQSILQKQPWGKEKSDLQNAPPDTWRLSGIVRISGQRFALIKINDKIQRCKAGDKLPCGEVLQAVYDDSVHLQIEGDVVRVVKLYQ